MPIKNLNSITVGQSTGINAGEIAWNPDEETFDMGLVNGVVLQAGHELYFYGKASENISNGDAVQFNGAQGSHLLVKKAVQSEVNAAPQYFIGVSTQDLTIGDFGYFTVFGKVRDLDTTIYRNGDPSSEGKILYFDSAGSTAGALTITPPVAPNAKIEVAAVVYDHAIQGTILVRPTISPMLEELQDFYNNGKTDGSIMVWDDTNEYWFDDDTVTIDYTNGNVGIGAASPAAKLDVNGNIHLSDLSGLQQITGGNGNIISFDNASFEYIFGSDIIKANPANGTFSMDLFGGAPFLSYDAASLVMDLSPNFGSSLVRLDGPNGRVGIGTTSPGYTLDVNGVIRGEQYLRLADTAGTNRFSIRTESTYSTIDNGSNSLYYNSSNHIFLIGLSEKMRINSSGNVGIGTTSPGAKLDVNGDSILNGDVVMSRNGDGARVFHSREGSDNITLGDIDGIYNGSSFTIDYRNDYYTFIKASVGIGTATPTDKLHLVNGNLRLESSGIKDRNNTVGSDGQVLKSSSSQTEWGWIPNTITSAFYHSSNSSGQAYYLPFHNLGETTSSQYYNNFIAPYAGRVRKMIIRFVSGTTPTATSFTTFRFVRNGTTVYNGTPTTTGGGTTSMQGVITLTDTNVTFSAGDRLQFGFITSGGTGLVYGCAATVVVEYTEI